MSQLNKEWYTTVEVAELLGRSDRYVRDRVKGGEIPAQLGGGAKRVSYKISREALVAWMISEEKMPAKQLVEMLKGVDEGYLEELQTALEEARMHKRSDYIIVPSGPIMRGPVMRMEQQHYPGFQIDEALMQRIDKNPLKINSSVINRKLDVAEGHLSLEITTVEFFEQMRCGDVREEYQPPWEPGHTPILYIDSLILEDPVWAPFLFRDLSRQVKAKCAQLKIEVKAAFAVAFGEGIKPMMERYGFEQVGGYEGYPIMLNKDIRDSRLGRYLR